MTPDENLNNSVPKNEPTEASPETAAEAESRRRADEAKVATKSPGRRAIARLRQNKMAMFGF
jgi:hypothetical protein